MKDYKFKQIATIHNGYTDKFGIPRQSGLINSMESVIVFEKEYRNDDALRGIEGYSHLWLIWNFSKTECENWHPTVRPPRLGGNKRMGVFATRSPFRPNPIGLSCVKFIRLEKTKNDGTVLIVSGADLLDGTPILDIKPYLTYTDSRADAVCGFADGVMGDKLEVEIPDEFKKSLTSEQYDIIIDILKNDPRPSYIENEDRVYSFEVCGFNIKFKVKDAIATVIDIK